MQRKSKNTNIFLLMLAIVFIITGCGGLANKSSTEKNTTEETGKTSVAKKEDFPAKPLQWIIPFSPGAANDLFVRPLAKVTEKYLGQSIVCDNKPGGSGSTAMSYLLSQPADGYTIVSYTSTMAFHMATGIAPFGVDDLAYIALVGGDSYILAVNSKSNFKTIKEFVQYAKEHPGEVKIGGPGTKTAPQFVTDVFSELAGIKMKWIPYEGGNEAAVALMGGNIDAIMVTSANIVSQIESGALRPLAISTPKRSENNPDIPTFRELGYDFDYILARGAVVKKGTPKDRITAIESALKKAVEDPEWKDFLKKMKLEWYFKGSAEFTEMVKKEVEEIKRYYGDSGKSGK
ncbi:MAG: putative tricarboxylic transport rane protein [Clostridia bacterium]|nr:putative tricarboxylic transport rane protein [Clostridia bacterium]